MSKMKIVNLSQYRKEKQQKANDLGQSNEDKRSFDEKLLDLIYKPFSETDSANELIAIFEEEQLKKR